MLTKVYVTKWEGIGVDQKVLDSTNGTPFLINGNRINGMQVRATTKSQLMYHFRKVGYREKPSYLETNQSCATINTNCELSWTNVFQPFSLYTDNDPSKATFTRYINCESIALVERDNVYEATKSWITYEDGSKLMKVLCSYSIDQVYSWVYDNNLTTS